MRCVFCKGDSSTSHAIEHIISESLGNTDHTLPAGIVCDACNNYIAREVEKPLLDSLYFRERRFHATLPNKKNRIPALDGVHLQSLTHIQLTKAPLEPYIALGAAPDADEARWLKSIRARQAGSLILPIGTIPDDYVVSRFIAKVGLEALAHRVLKVPGAIDEIVDKPGLEELRTYVRRGTPGAIWPHSSRRLYEPDARFSDGDEVYQMLHEFDILVTDQNEFYVIVAIFGDEYALNLGGREIGGYERWLEMNSKRSPLYSGKNGGEILLHPDH